MATETDPPRERERFEGLRLLTVHPNPVPPPTEVSIGAGATNVPFWTVKRDPTSSDFVELNDQHWGDFVFRVDHPIKVRSLDFFGSMDNKKTDPFRFEVRLWESPGTYNLNSSLLVNADTTVTYEPKNAAEGNMLRVLLPEPLPVLQGGQKYQYTIEFRMHGPLLFQKKTETHFGTRVVDCAGTPVTFTFYGSDEDWSPYWQLPAINFDM